MGCQLLVVHITHHWKNPVPNCVTCFYPYVKFLHIEFVRISVILCTTTFPNSFLVPGHIPLSGAYILTPISIETWPFLLSPNSRRSGAGGDGLSTQSLVILNVIFVSTLTFTFLYFDEISNAFFLTEMQASVYAKVETMQYNSAFLYQAKSLKVTEIYYLVIFSSMRLIENYVHIYLYVAVKCLITCRIFTLNIPFPKTRVGRETLIIKCITWLFLFNFIFVPTVSFGIRLLIRCWLETISCIFHSCRIVFYSAGDLSFLVCFVSFINNMGKCINFCDA